jgi:hypothetical protein
VEITGNTCNSSAVNISQRGSPDDPSRTPAVTLDLVATLCGAGECPTVYRTDRGTLVVQGYGFDPADAGLVLPSGERMVEIPLALLAECARLAA